MHINEAVREIAEKHREPEREEWHADWHTLYTLVESNCTGHPDCPAPHAALGNLLTALKSRDIKLARLHRETATLTERLARAQLDRERLDWLEGQAAEVTLNMASGRRCITLADFNQPGCWQVAAEEETVRDAIDTARRAAAGGGE